MGKKSIEQILPWVDLVKPKSPVSMKNHQRELAEQIVAAIPGFASSPTVMTIGAPRRLQVVTKSGSSSARYFIGGEEVVLKTANVTQRTYKLMLEFGMVGASDIQDIKIPFIDALEAVSGLEIRLLGSPGFAAFLEKMDQVTSEMKFENNMELSNKYDSIGYGSW